MLSQLAEWFLKEKTENCAAVEKAFYTLALPSAQLHFPPINNSCVPQTTMNPLFAAKIIKQQQIQFPN